MRIESDQKEDGRAIIFYTFDDEGDQGDEQASTPDAHSNGGDQAHDEEGHA